MDIFVPVKNAECDLGKNMVSQNAVVGGGCGCGGSTMPLGAARMRMLSSPSSSPLSSPLSVGGRLRRKTAVRRSKKITKKTKRNLRRK
jgi:hypothetical protein